MMDSFLVEPPSSPIIVDRQQDVVEGNGVDYLRSIFSGPAPIAILALCAIGTKLAVFIMSPRSCNLC